MASIWNNGWAVLAVVLALGGVLAWVLGKHGRASVFIVLAAVFFFAHLWSADTIGSEGDDLESTGVTPAPEQVVDPTPAS